MNLFKNIVEKVSSILSTYVYSEPTTEELLRSILSTQECRKITDETIEKLQNTLIHKKDVLYTDNTIRDFQDWYVQTIINSDLEQQVKKAEEDIIQLQEIVNEIKVDKQIHSVVPEIESDDENEPGCLDDLNDEDKENVVCSLQISEDHKYFRSTMTNTWSSITNEIEFEKGRILPSYFKSDYSMFSYYTKLHHYLEQNVIKPTGNKGRSSKRIKKITLNDIISQAIKDKLINDTRFFQLTINEYIYRIYSSFTIHQLGLLYDKLDEYQFVGSLGNKRVTSTLDKDTLLDLLFLGIQMKSNHITSNIMFVLTMPNKKLRTRIPKGVVEMPGIYNCIKASQGRLKESQDSSNSCEFTNLVVKMFDTITNLSVKSSEPHSSYLKYLRCVILWLDTHHDFKNGRLKDNVGKDIIEFCTQYLTDKKDFISWYADEFFVVPTGSTLSSILFDYNKIGDTIFQPFQSLYFDSRTSQNNDVITLLSELSTTLYHISLRIRNSDFERRMLMIYINKYYLYQPSSTEAPETIFNKILYYNKELSEDLLKAQPIINKNTFGEQGDNNVPVSFLKAIRNKKYKYAQDAGEPNYNLDHSVTYSEQSRKVRATLYNQEIYSSLFDANKSNKSSNLSDTLKANQNKEIIIPIGSNLFRYNYTNKSKSNCYLVIDNNSEEAPGERQAFIDGRVECGGEFQSSRDSNADKTHITELLQAFKTAHISKRDEKTRFENEVIPLLYKEINDYLLSRFVINGKDKEKIPNQYFNVKNGPSVHSLYVLIIYHLLRSKVDNIGLPLSFWDTIVTLKRIGDYGQVLDAKQEGYAFFTVDYMENLMCLMEGVSCMVYNGVGLMFYVGGKDNFICSKNDVHYHYRTPLPLLVQPSSPVKRTTRQKVSIQKEEKDNTYMSRSFFNRGWKNPRITK